MPDVEKIQVLGTDLDICDTVARARVQQNAADIAANSAAIGVLENQIIGKIDFSNIVVIGDSFVKGSGLDHTTDSFAYQFPQLIGAKKYQVFGEGGVGFYKVASAAGVNAAQYLERIKPNITDPENVTCCIVCFGWNDYAQTPSNVRAGAKAFWDLLKTVLPNATPVYMCNPSLSCLDKYVIGACYTAAYTSGIPSIESWWWELGREDLFQSDKLHPSMAGHLQIAQKLRDTVQGLNVMNYVEMALSPLNNCKVTMTFWNTNVTFEASGLKGVREASSEIASWPDWLFSGVGSGKAAYRGVLPFESDGVGCINWGSDEKIYVQSYPNGSGSGTYIGGNFYWKETFNIPDIIG